MQLTPLETEVSTCIERHRRLNPDGLSAREWIEGSELTQEEIGARFGCSYTIVSTLCRKLGVERNLRALRDLDGHPNTRNGRWFRGPSELERKREHITECLKKAREGSSPAKRELLSFGIKFIDGRGNR